MRNMSPNSSSYAMPLQRLAVITSGLTLLAAVTVLSWALWVARF